MAWVDSNIAKRHTGAYAKAYLEYLYTKQAQETIAQDGYRPVDPEILKEHAAQFPLIELFSVTLFARDWEDAQQRFFADKGIHGSIRPVEAKQDQVALR